MEMNLKSGYVTEDGKVFATKAEAVEYLRTPIVRAQLLLLTGNNKELSSWLAENRDDISAAFESTRVRRVTKAERNALKKALDAVKAADDRRFAFIADNAEAIFETFRWPSVKRGSEEQQAETIKTSLMEATDGNEELVTWLLENKDAVLEAFEAGKVKREVNPKAQAALAEYRAKKAAEQAAAQAAKSDEQKEG